MTTKGAAEAVSAMFGKILHVDLSTRSIYQEEIRREEVFRLIGGRGINAYLLWKLLKPGTDPLGSDSVIIFGCGLLAGSAAPSSGRTTITCLSPATNRYLKTNVGGYWGAELRYAGFSHLAVYGRLETPGYIWIDDSKVEVRDGRRVWGQDVRATNKLIKEELGDENIQIACIGPGGEHLVKFASIMVSVYNAAGRGGAGAVMGSKNLKAIAVRGSCSVSAAEPASYHRLALNARECIERDSGFGGMAEYGTSGGLEAINELRAVPAYNFRKSHVADITSLSGQYLVERNFLKRRVACFSCPVGCHRYCRVGDGSYANSYGGGPEYESMSALGSGCGVFQMEGVIKANEMANILGLDTISVGSAIQWAMECYEKGVISQKDLGGVRAEWGDAEAVVKMIRMIAFRNGFGDVLADGVMRAAEKVGRGSAKWAVQAKGLEQSRVDTRVAKAYALAFAVNPRGPDHLHAAPFGEFGLSAEATDLIGNITGTTNLARSDTIEKRAEIVRWHEDCYAAADSLGLCIFACVVLYGITPSLMAGLFSAATGHKMSEKEILLAGRRTVNIERCFNARLGFSRSDDVLPWRVMNEASPDHKDIKAVNSAKEMDEMLSEYYRLHEWDIETGIPKPETLNNLGLGDFVVDEPIK